MIDKMYIMAYAFNRVERNGKVYYEEPKEGSREYNNNLVVATQFGVLTSNQVMALLFTPGNFVEPKKLGYLLSFVKLEVARRVLEELSKREYPLTDDDIARISALTYDEFSQEDDDTLKDLCFEKKNLAFADIQMLFHKQNMTAGKLIGIFALGNVSHGFISLTESTVIYPTDEDGFIFDGHMICTHPRGSNGLAVGVVIDSMTNFDGELISSKLAALLAASVDAVKDPILNLININEDTAGMVVSMLRMGFSLELVALFCALPSVVQAVTTYAIRNAKGEKCSLSSVVDSLIDDIPDNIKGDRHNKNYESINITTLLLKENLIGHNPLTNYMVLEVLLRMLPIATTFRRITHMTKYNSITSAVGPFAANTMVLYMLDNAFAHDPLLNRTELDESGRTEINALAVFESVNNPILKAFRDNAHRAERLILGNNLIQASNSFGLAMQTLAETLGLDSLTDELANKFSDFYMSYYVNTWGEAFPSSSNGESSLSYSNREYMITLFPTDFLALKNKHNNNLFINSIQYVENESEEYPFLRVKTRGVSSETIEDMKLAWLELYLDEDTTDLAIRLMEYSFFRGSFGFNPKTFMNLVPSTMKLAMPNYIAALNRNESLDSKGHLNRCIMLFLLHNLDAVRGGKWKNLDLFIKEDSTKVIDGRTYRIALREVNSEYKGKIVKYTLPITKSGIIKTKEQTYIVVKDDSLSDDYALLMEVDALGGNGLGFEISTTEDFPKTVFKGSKESELKDNNDSLDEAPIEDKKESIDNLKVLMSFTYSALELMNLANSNVSPLRITEAINAKLREMNLRCGFQITKRSSTIDAIKGILSSLKGLSEDDIRNILNGANKTINDLNLCD